MVSKILWLIGSFIFFALGTIHVVYTFFTTKFNPRKQNLIDEMKNDSLRLTKETTMWKAWIGFNASHGAGAVFIGCMNGILAIEYFYVIENSFLISILTIVTSVFYLWLARKFWFSIPFQGIFIATCCFIVSPILSFFQ